LAFDSAIPQGAASILGFLGHFRESGTTEKAATIMIKGQTPSPRDNLIANFATL
jgi:hypothetical protein